MSWRHKQGQHNLDFEVNTIEYILEINFDHKILNPHGLAKLPSTFEHPHGLSRNMFFFVNNAQDICEFMLATHQPTHYSKNNLQLRMNGKMRLIKRSMFNLNNPKWRGLTCWQIINRKLCKNQQPRFDERIPKHNMFCKVYCHQWLNTLNANQNRL